MWFEGGAVAEHGEQYVDAAAGETHQGLFAALPLVSFALTMGPGRWIGQRGESCQ